MILNFWYYLDGWLFDKQIQPTQSLHKLWIYWGRGWRGGGVKILTLLQLPIHVFILFSLYTLITVVYIHCKLPCVVEFILL